VVAAPEVEQFYSIDHAQYALWTFAVPMLVASLIEAPIALASDRYSRARVLSGALFVLALSLAGCASRVRRAASRAEPLRPSSSPSIRAGRIRR
jgi:hypothetical protein